MLRKTKLFGVLGAAVVLVVQALPVAAQGWIEPTILGSGFGVDKIRSEVRVRVDGRVAEFEVTEWFVNDGTRTAEGHYLYPLPGEAVFQGFSLFQGDVEVRGEILNADEARRVYEDLVRRHADPALIELAGNGLLRARVFPIEPGDERKVSMRFTQVLERAGNSLQLVYAGAVRGSDAEMAGAPDAPTLSESVETKFEVEVVDGDGYLEPFSPTHTLEVDRHGGLLTVGVDGEVMGRMAIFLPLAGQDVGVSIATHRPVGEDGFFMLTLSPGAADGFAAPRDITVVLDVSGSMSGDKMVQAREALRQILGSLARQDRFRLLAFSNTVRMQSETWSDATGFQLANAREWIGDLIADGGTNIGAALEEAFRLESPEDRLPVVIFLTDGIPSVGEQSAERLADQAESKAGRARVFAFGVGHDVNTHLLDRLGEAGRGSTAYVDPGENVERVVALLAAKIQHPVLTDLELAGGPIRVAEIYPVRIPDVFAGEELVLFGRYQGDGQSRLTVVGNRAGDGLEFSAEARFPRASEANGYLPRLWASRKLGHLQRRLWTEGQSSELIGEIRDLALRYGLLTEYTSYLVEEPDFVTQPAQAQFDPSRQQAPAAFAAASGAARDRTAAQSSGEGAVRRAEQARGLRDADTMDKLRLVEREIASMAPADEGGASTRAAGGRLFRLDGGVWTDVNHSNDKRVVSVRAFSEGYFDLMQALNELQPILRERGEFLIAGESVSIRIGPDGVEQFEGSALQALVKEFRRAGGTP